MSAKKVGVVWRTEAFYAADLFGVSPCKRMPLVEVGTVVEHREKDALASSGYSVLYPASFRNSAPARRGDVCANPDREYPEAMETEDGISCPGLLSFANNFAPPSSTRTNTSIVFEPIFPLPHDCFYRPGLYCSIAENATYEGREHAMCSVPSSSPWCHGILDSDKVDFNPP